MRCLVLVLLVATLPACAKSTAHARVAGTAAMTGDEAWALVDQLQAEQGGQVAYKPIKSLDAALAAVKADDTARFDRVIEFLNRQPDTTSLPTRAWVGLLDAEAGMMAAELYQEFVETSARAAPRPSGSEIVQRREAARLAQYRKAVDALEILSLARIASSERWVEQALEKQPAHPRSHIALAMLQRVRGDWDGFDETMARIEAAGIVSATTIYLRGTEALYRRRDLAGARAAFEEALRRDPRMVRAQAHLLLAQDSIAGMHAELETLHAMAPRHFMVLVAGPAIDAAFATLMEDAAG